ncbi:MAG: hydrolase 1, exosortase A system-associated, partial [Gammaproteobacteria bacterium]
EAETVDPGPNRAAPAPARPAFTEAMREGLARFDGRVLVILSGEDLTAAEFRDMVAGSRSWRKLLDAPGVSHVDFPDATHTFSRRVWRDRVAACTSQWVTSW